MSPISEQLSKDNFNFTQAKNLIGSSLVNSLSSSNNIWNSNNLSNLANSDNLMLSNGMANLNYFEDSRLWLSKKFYLSSSVSNYVLNYNSSQPISNDLKFKLLVAKL
jgi:hypothetical protein